MNKTDLLLRMLEHPHEYTDEEWQQILLDEECRELYTLMAKTRSALNAARANDQLTDETIDAEWQLFERQHSLGFNCSKNLNTKSLREYVPLKIAVSFIGFLLITGIALAAFHFVQSTRKAQPKTSETTSAINTTIRLDQSRFHPNGSTRLRQHNTGRHARRDCLCTPCKRCLPERRRPATTFSFHMETR